MTEEFLEENRIRVKRLFKSEKHDEFENGNHLGNWYREKLIEQEGKCKYCQTEILLIRSLIETNKLVPRAAGTGVRRPNLEIDRDNPNLGYSPNNCHLVCYYCNNDKSYTLDADTYTEFFGEARRNFFLHLANQ